MDSDLPYESLEATAIFDWENGYVECSAKERTNINKIFKELLNQAKNRFDVSLASPTKPSNSGMNSASAFRHLPGIVASQQKAALGKMEDCLRRRQSLPAVPAGMGLIPDKFPTKIVEEDEVFRPTKLSSGSTRLPSGGALGGKRRSSLAALRRDSCKIS